MNIVVLPQAADEFEVNVLHSAVVALAMPNSLT